MHVYISHYEVWMGIVWNIQINCLPLQSKQEKWSLGRVARHRSAKPFTAVRIRQRPQVKSRNPSIRGLWDFCLGDSCAFWSIKVYRFAREKRSVGQSYSEESVSVWWGESIYLCYFINNLVKKCNFLYFVSENCLPL